MAEGKSNNSNCSSDQYELDPREIPLNGFNRFDPKYISIGPKALRETSLMTTNLKCATLRHGGRYGGSLTERGLNPVLKKASTPSVATVSKEFNVSNVNSVEIKNNITNCSLTGVNNNRNSGSYYSHKRSTVQQPNENNVSEYNLKRIYSIEQPNFGKHPNSKILSNSHKISILNQPLPEIPPKIKHIQRNQQLLSASSLNKNRSIGERNKSCGSKSLLVEQPPLLPPKNRNRYITEKKLSTSKLEQIQSKPQAHFSYNTFEMRKPRIYDKDIHEKNLFISEEAAHQSRIINFQKSKHQTLPQKTKNRTSHKVSGIKEYEPQYIENTFRSHLNVSNKQPLRTSFHELNHSKDINKRTYRDSIDFTGIIIIE